MTGPRRRIGHPHIHLAELGSTSDRARELAESGAPHGTTVSADRQVNGRGRQGRAWSSPEGAIAVSCVLRLDKSEAELLPLAAALAAAHVCGQQAMIKWPNDIWLTPGRKVAGVLIDARPPADWYVVGIGVNVAVDLATLEPDVAARAATLGRPASELPEWRTDLISALESALHLDRATLVSKWRERDALRDAAITWSDGASHGRAHGIDDHGHLLVEHADGKFEALVAGEVHLGKLG